MRRDSFSKYLTLGLLPLLLIMQTGHAQEGSSESEFSLERYEPITIDLEEEEEEEDGDTETKKKRKKKVFYGIKTKKGFIKSGYGERTTFEIFYYLKDPRETDPYVREKYWFDRKRKSLEKGPEYDPEEGNLLHGPYKRIRNDQVLEKGIYYLGTKHGRWTEYTSDDILLDKEKYYKGWPKESRVSFYDKDRTKLKEVIPVKFGVVEGNYYMFYENGEVAVEGQYENGRKVGRWTEYYNVRRRRKKEIIYPPDGYSAEIKPYINREWNLRSKMVYDRDDYVKKLD